MTGAGERLRRVLALALAPLGPTLAGLQVIVTSVAVVAPAVGAQLGWLPSYVSPGTPLVLAVLFGVAAFRLQTQLDRHPSPLWLRYDPIRDPDCHQVGPDGQNPDLETYRVGVVNPGPLPVSGVTVEVVRLWGAGLGYGKRKLRHKDDRLVGGEFAASMAGITVRPNGDEPSAYFDVVHKFYRDVPDERYTTGHRFLDQVYVSYADKGGAVVVPDANLTGITLRLRSDRGREEERTFAVYVTGGRLFLKLPED